MKKVLFLIKGQYAQVVDKNSIRRGSWATGQLPDAILEALEVDGAGEFERTVSFSTRSFKGATFATCRRDEHGVVEVIPWESLDKGWDYEPCGDGFEGVTGIRSTRKPFKLYFRVDKI